MNEKWLGFDSTMEFETIERRRKNRERNKE